MLKKILIKWHVKIFLVWIFTISSALCSYSQQYLYSKAVQCYEKELYDEAIFYFSTFIEQYEKMPSAYYYLAKSYKANLQYSNAMQSYEELMRYADKKFIDAYFDMAELYELIGNKNLAIQYYRKFLEKSSFLQHDRTQQLFARKKIELGNWEMLCDSSLCITKDTISPFFHNFGTYSANSSLVYNGIKWDEKKDSLQMFFSTDSTYSALLDTLQGLLIGFITDVQQVERGTYILVRRENPHLFSPAELLLWTRDSSGAHTFIHIEVGLFEGATLIQPKLATINDSLFLFFSSNMAGGYGGFDIWYARFAAPYTMLKAINAGENINSPFDEICPYFNTKDSTLYYSAKLPESIGGFDIYSSHYTRDNFSLPKKLPAPINSSYNDLYYTRYDSIAYFVSNREVDIIGSYYYNANKVYSYPILLAKDSLPTTSIEIPAAVRIFFDSDKPYHHIEKEPLPALVEDYMLVLSSNVRELQSSKDFYIKNYVYSQALETIINEFSNCIDAIDSLLHYIYIHADAMDDYYIELSSYTDSRGDIAYNKALAQRRAAVVELYIYMRWGNLYTIELPCSIQTKTHTATKQEYNEIGRIRQRRTEIALKKFYSHD